MDFTSSMPNKVASLAKKETISNMIKILGEMFYGVKGKARVRNLQNSMNVLKSQFQMVTTQKYLEEEIIPEIDG